MERRLHQLAPLAVTAIFAAALWQLHQALRDLRYEDLWLTVEHLAPGRLLAALALTAAGYLALTGYDVLALRYVRHPLAYPKTVLASFISFAFSNTVGLALLTGASVRTRLYSAWQLPAPAITRVIAFCAVTLWIGLLSVGGLALLLEPDSVARAFHLVPAAAQAAGGALLLTVLAYLAWCARWRTSRAIFGWTFDTPSLGLALGQIVVSTLDWMFAAGTLYVLLPPGTGLSYPAFAGLFVLAQAGGLASHVPGGLGVFEGLLVLLAPPQVPVAALAGSLIAFRVIYYLLPLSGAGMLLAGHEMLRHREQLGQWSRAVGRVVPALAPVVLAAGTFVAGVILLLSGATPTVGWRLELLKDFVPLPVIETSHFIGSVTGAALLLLAHGLYRRLDAAWALTVALLLTGIVASLLKGFDFEEATIAALMLAALLPSRRVFYRRASLVEERFTPGWAVAVAVVLGTSIWLGFFAYRRVEYTNALWWRFEFAGDAPRFLRATVGAVTLALVVGLSRLLRPTRPEPTLPTPADLERARQAIVAGARPAGNLAFLGDKSLLFSESGRAFVMYAVEGRSWVAMGDPVGDESEFPDLAWRFRELSDRHAGWTVFYEVSRPHLPLYLDLGLTLLKLGEEARVPLEAFSLEGGARAGLRRWKNAVERAGGCFEVLPPEQAAELMPELRRVSDAWLSEKETREKRFSLGSFSEEYLGHFPIAVVRVEQRIVAFANLWTTGTKVELMVDLMRYAPDAPANVMSYLFVQLMLWGKAEGYRWFNLGMAPLSGLHGRALAPLWNRLGSFVFRHGEHFYNFQGLREYKQRFDPTWEPRYLASPGGLTLPFVLTNISALIGGGIKGAIAK